MKDGHNALGFALGMHRSPEQRKRENIAAVSCLLSRNVDLPSKSKDVNRCYTLGQSSRK